MAKQVTEAYRRCLCKQQTHCDAAAADEISMHAISHCKFTALSFTKSNYAITVTHVL